MTTLGSILLLVACVPIWLWAWGRWTAFRRASAPWRRRRRRHNP